MRPTRLIPTDATRQLSPVQTYHIGDGVKRRFRVTSVVGGTDGSHGTRHTPSSDRPACCRGSFANGSRLPANFGLASRSVARQPGVQGLGLGGGGWKEWLR